MPIAIQKGMFGEDRLVSGDVVERVTYILKEFPYARNSYPCLIARYWGEFDGLRDLLGEEKYEEFVSWITTSTSPKTIQNRAGEIQNDRPDLEACPDVADWRTTQSRAGRVK